MPNNHITPPAIPRHFQKYVAPPPAPGLYYRWFVRPRWRGPFYFLDGARLEDMKSVLFLISAIARINAPMPQGLEAAAVDAVEDLQFEWSKIRRTGLLISVAVLVSAIAFSVSIYDVYQRNEAGLALAALLYAVLVPALIALIVLPKSRKQAVLLHLRDRLESGDQLSDVMRAMSRFFPAIHADLAELGETSGRLPECLDFMAARIQQSLEARARVQGALGYSLLCILVITGIVVFMAFKVFPVFDEIMEEFAADTRHTVPILQPWFLMSPVLLGYVALGAALLFSAAALVSGFVLRRRGWNAGLLSSLGLALPWFRPLTLHANLLQIALQLEMLLWAGMPLPAALDRVANSDLNFLYRRALRKAARRSSNGDTLAAALGAQPLLFTRRFVDSVRLGEYTGQLPAALNSFAEHASGVVAARGRVFFDMQPPLYTLVLGYFVAAIMVYVFGTMVSVAEMAVLW